MRQRECTLKHVPDADMPADFLTKFIGGPKFRQSVDYLTNRRAAVKPKADDSPPTPSDPSDHEPKQPQ